MKKEFFRMLFVVAALLVFVPVTEAQRFLQESTDGVACWANTVKDGSGTAYQPLVDSDGHLQIDVLSGASGGVSNTVSTNNSTTSTLSGSATFTGTWEDVSSYSAVTINVFADVDSSSGGMQFQLSSDGSNADDVYSFTLDASQSTDRRFQFPVTAKYFRVVYTNGGSAQSAFRLQTIFHSHPVRTSIHRVDDTVTTDRSAELVKSVGACKIAEGAEAVVGTNGEYENCSMTPWRELRTRDQRALDLANCNDYTDYTALGNDTSNLADETDHVFGTGAITFDKVNGAANTVYAGVSDSFTAVDLSERFEDGSFVGLSMKVASVADVVAAFVRIGTDSSNYNEWEWPVADLGAGNWNALRAATNQPSAYAGNGWNPASVAYVAFGVEFSDETDTLSGIIFDNVHLVAGRVTDSTTVATINSSINTPNINIHRVGGSAADTNTGNASAATLRVVLPNDQPVLSVDDNSSTLSVDDGAGSLTVDGTLTCDAGTGPWPVTDNSGSLTVDNAGTFVTQVNGAALTALQLIDNMISGSEAQVDIVSAPTLDCSGATVPVSDASGSLTVDNGGTFAVQSTLQAGTNLVGDINIQSSSTSGDGAGVYFDADCDNTAQSVKAGSGNLKGWYISNTNTAVAYVQIYNIASGSVTVGTSTPTLSLGIPPNDGAANVLSEPGIGFGTQISVACTTTATGSTDPTTGLVVNLIYE